MLQDSNPPEAGLMTDLNQVLIAVRTDPELHCHTLRQVVGQGRTALRLTVAYDLWSDER